MLSADVSVPVTLQARVMKSPSVLFAVVLMLAGILLVLFARGRQFFWFEGGPLGVVLVVVGVFDLVGALRTTRR